MLFINKDRWGGFYFFATKLLEKGIRFTIVNRKEDFVPKEGDFYIGPIACFSDTKGVVAPSKFKVEKAVKRPNDDSIFFEVIYIEKLEYDRTEEQASGCWSQKPKGPLGETLQPIKMDPCVLGLPVILHGLEVREFEK